MFLVVLLFGTLIGAVILRASCALFNRLAGGSDSPNAVPEPSFGKAMAIVFLAFLVKLATAAVIALAASGGHLDAPASHSAQQTASVMSSLAAFFALAGASTVILPTSFGKSVVLAITYAVVAFVVVGIPIIVGSLLIS